MSKQHEHVMTAKDQDMAHELKNEFLDLCLKRKANALVALAAAKCAAECFEEIIREQGGEVFTVSGSERCCGECKHYEFRSRETGYCRELLNWYEDTYCGCKCVFPDTGVLAQAKHKVDVKANVDWLKANAQNFAGEWVAIRSGVLLDVDKSHSALLKRIGPTKGTDILVTWAYDPATDATGAKVSRSRIIGAMGDVLSSGVPNSVNNNYVVVSVEAFDKLAQVHRELIEDATTGAAETEQQLNEVAAQAYVDGFDAASAPAATAEGQDDPWIDAHGHTWERRLNVECVECPDCCFTFAAMHGDGDGSGYSCPNCGTGETAPAGVEAAAQEIADWITQTTPLAVGDALRLSIQRIIFKHCAAPVAAESEEAETVNGSEDSWMTL